MDKVGLALFVSMFVVGCRGDASMSKEIAGVWSWKPSSELPPNEVKQRGFPTPTLESVKLETDGRYVLVQQIPGYDTDVGGTRVAVPEEWHEWKGTWAIANGKLEMNAGAGEDRWLAKRREGGWVAEGDPVAWERAFEIVELKRSELRLRAIAIGDFNRTFHRADAMPERPTLKQ
ncbi:MAG: hypothetical protein HYZ29_06775 [Myxococcales bacterium]|nr:hypothetical protein [Myxococcales bacterium]